jgi:APA family basic amino acid/polyamine antiporter
VFFAMSRDGLLPPVFSHVHPQYRTPMRVIMVTGSLIALIAGFLPIEAVAELVNVGTLAAFILVSIGVIILRRTQPDLHRPFRAPLVPLTPILAIMACSYLLANLGAITLWRFVIWMALGFILYFGYARRHSLLARQRMAANSPG